MATETKTPQSCAHGIRWPHECDLCESARQERDDTRHATAMHVLRGLVLADTDYQHACNIGSLSDQDAAESRRRALLNDARDIISKAAS